MPIPLDDAAKPHTILLFDDGADYRQPLTEALALAKIAVDVTEVKAAFAFQLALAREWDAILVTYAVAQEALAILRQVDPAQTVIVLYAPQEEEQAFALPSEQISDLVSNAALRRLPLILRREWKLKQSQKTALLLPQLEMRFRTIVEGFGDTILIADAAKMKAQFARRHQLENTSYEFLLQRPDGQPLYLLAQGAPLLDEAGNYNGSFSIVTDITAQKQAEEALRQALAKEQELGELKSRFVSVASHEFRTPLATISATAETLIAYRDRLDSNQLDARLHKILAQVEHMKEIMEDVLQLARIQAGRVDFIPAAGDLKALCNEIIEEFSGRREYQGRIMANTAGPSLNFCFDARLMRHVISNLITNGLKYSPTTQPITVNLDQVAETIVLQVMDHGIGIPDADLKHIFEPFHRASNVGTISGTGLGLSITKEAVHLHGGIIQINTQINTGTTFTVSLPITPERITTDVKNPDY